MAGGGGGWSGAHTPVAYHPGKIYQSHPGRQIGDRVGSCKVYMGVGSEETTNVHAVVKSGIPMENGVGWGCMLHTLVSYRSTRVGRYTSCAALSSSPNDPLRSTGDRSTFQQNRGHCRVRRMFWRCWSVIGDLYSYGEHPRRVPTRGFTNPSHDGPRTKIWTCSALTGPYRKPSGR